MRASVRRPKRAIVLVAVLSVVVCSMALYLGASLGAEPSDGPGPQEDDLEEASSSALGVLPVEGTVTDSLGNPVLGASVRVMSISGTTVVAEYTWTTDDMGFYTVTFDVGEFAIGWTIAANATYGLLWVNESVVIDETSEAGVVIDLELPAAIPEFSSLLLVVGATALVVIIASIRRKKRL